MQCSTPNLKGRKLFVWGQGQGGRNWNEWLSEPGSAYIEIQAGLAHTQLEHIPMNGGETWEWVEAYTAFSGDPQVMHGDYKGAVDTVESLHKQNWYSLLHTGVIKYAKGDTEGAKEAWEKSAGKRPSPWALRNLSMIYKNELGDTKRAREYILRAFDMKKNCPALCNEVAAQLTTDGGDQMWLDIYSHLAPELQKLGRLRLYKAIALMNLNSLREAAEIINDSFEMSDIKEGELSVSQLWFELYRRLYAKETGREYNPEDEKLCKEADEKYPLPKSLDFRMHE